MKLWQLTYDGVTFTDDDLNGQDRYDIEFIVGAGWSSVDVTDSWVKCSWTVAVHVARVKGLDAAAIHSRLMSLPSDQIPIPEPRELAVVSDHAATVASEQVA